jgi:hypothetical protein
MTRRFGSVDLPSRQDGGGQALADGNRDVAERRLAPAGRVRRAAAQPCPDTPKALAVALKVAPQTATELLRDLHRRAS